LGAAAYSLVLVFTAPATLVDAAVRRASDGMLRVAEAQGSIWSGAGQLELLDKQRHTGIAKGVSWHLLPGSLWGGRPVYEIQLADAATPARMTMSPSRVDLANVVVELPAGAIVLATPKLMPAQLTGDMSISASDVAIDRNGVRGSVTLRWHNAGSALTPVAPLGEYELQIVSEPTGTHATLRTLKGPLELTGEGSWLRPNPPVFSTMARVPPQYLEQIAPVLRLIGSEIGNGTFRLALR
jgi:general secretion pathway protein N